MIADVDNDGHADLVVVSDTAQEGCPKVPEAETHVPWTGQTAGLLVFRDPLNRWMPSRPLWNQHTYHITNINDDLTIPKVEQPNWRSWNNFRQNVQGHKQYAGGPRADLTGGVATEIDNEQSDCASTWTLHANLCNRGNAELAPGVAGSFYVGDPRLPDPQVVCTTRSQQALLPGACERLSCDWKSPPHDAVDLWFRGDDDGGAKSDVAECKEMNNLLHLPGSRCGNIQ